jgi:hypothetical protein
MEISFSCVTNLVTAQGLMLFNMVENESSLSKPIQCKLHHKTTPNGKLKLKE